MVTLHTCLISLEQQVLSMAQKEALTLEEVAQAVENGTIDEYLLPIEKGVERFKRVDITDEVWQKVKTV